VGLPDVISASQIFPDTPVDTPAGPVPLRAVMVAIAGAESTFGNSMEGDKIGSTYRLPNGESGTIPASRWNCNGYTSFGPWQIHLPAQHDLIARLSGTSDPCAMAAWLKDYRNSARAALEVYRSEGLGAWTAYTTGLWRQYLPQAMLAVGGGMAMATPVAAFGLAGGGTFGAEVGPWVAAILLLLGFAYILSR
jgi:hypothetical protein